MRSAFGLLGLVLMAGIVAVSMKHAVQASHLAAADAASLPSSVPSGASTPYPGPAAPSAPSDPFAAERQIRSDVNAALQQGVDARARQADAAEAGDAGH
jgi:hypothetical protein